MRKTKYLFIFLVFTSCGLKTFTLQDGITEVASNPKVYSNKVKFLRSELGSIDTLTIFEEYNTFEKILERYNYKQARSHYGAYRFYGNGCFNYFILDRKDTILSTKMFDPNYSGWRGIYYKNKNKIKGDLSNQISGMGEIGKLTMSFEFKGDTLFVSAKNRDREVYIKRYLPISVLNRQANW